MDSTTGPRHCDSTQCIIATMGMPDQDPAVMTMHAVEVRLLLCNEADKDP